MKNPSAKPASVLYLITTIPEPPAFGPTGEGLPAPVPPTVPVPPLPPPPVFAKPRPVRDVDPGSDVKVELADGTAKGSPPPPPAPPFPTSSDGP